MIGHRVVDPPRLTFLSEADGSGIGGHHGFAIACDQPVRCLDGIFLDRYQFGLLCGAGGFANVPEAFVVHFHMAEPDRLMVRVIFGFTCHAFAHRIVAGHADTVGSDHRVEDGFLVPFVDIFGEQFTVDVDRHFALACVERDLTIGLHRRG